MSQTKTNETEAGLGATLVGGGLMYLSGYVGDQMTEATATFGDQLANLTDITGALPAGMLGLGAAMTTWGVSTLAHRWSRRGRVRAKYQNPGWAGWANLHKHLSPASTIKVAAHTRESYKDVKWFNRAWYLSDFSKRYKTTDHGVYLGGSVVGPAYTQHLYASYRDVILVQAPPQSGKTAWLCGAIIDAAGAVVATSTKADIYDLTHLLRRRDDRPILLFNPGNLGGLQSTVRFNLIRGCDNPKTAKNRAENLIQGTRSMSGDQGRHPDADWWDAQAAKVLRCQLLAAALDGKGMDTVAKWATSPNDQTPLDILREHPTRVPETWLFELRQVLSTSADKTRESIFLTLARAVEFMSDAGAAAIASAGPGEDALDIETFVRDRGTLYVLGDDKTLAPLIVALTQHLFEGAKHYAGSLGGRLDPPVSFILDEAALIVPVDLVRWVADAGGRNINIIISVQAMAQLYNIYNERGGQVIKNSANTEMIFGNLKLVEELRAIAETCGTYKMLQVTETDSAAATSGQNGRRSTSKVEVTRPIIEAAQIREIPEHHALILHRTAAPTLVRTTPVWERRDVKKAFKKAGKSVKAAAAAAAADAKKPALTEDDFTKLEADA